MELQNSKKQSIFHIIYNDELNYVSKKIYDDLKTFIKSLTDRGMIRGQICINNNCNQTIEILMKNIFPFDECLDEIKDKCQYIKLPQIYDYKKYSSVVIFVWSKMGLYNDTITCNDHPFINININEMFIYPKLLNKSLNDIPVLLLLDCARPSSYCRSITFNQIFPDIPNIVNNIFIGIVYTTEYRRETENLNFFKIIFKNLNSKISFQDNFNNSKKDFRRMNFDAFFIEKNNSELFINLIDF